MQEEHSPTRPTQTGSNRLGVAGLIISIVGVCLCGFWLLTIPGLILSLIGLRKEPRTAAIAGSVLGGVGIMEFLFIAPLMLGLLLPALSRAQMKAKEIHTNATIHLIEVASETYKIDNGKYPTSFAELEQSHIIVPDDTKDAWNHEMKFEGGGNTKPVITSAGVDGEFGTEDDLPNDLQEK